ncbi:MAG: hypothetical protein ACLUG4_07810 [Bacilli bacterium]|mgnify:FL=1|nr:hypothetical protein [Staphylococcus sp.]
MNSTTSISYNNSPYTIQSTSANGVSISFQVNQNMMNTNTNVKINNAKKSSKTNIPSNKKK